MGEAIELVNGSPINARDASRQRIVASGKKLGNLNVNDHFTLSNPSSTITFKDQQNIIFQVGQSQIVLEKGLDDVVTAKEIVEESPGYFLLRAAYTVIAFLLSGFLFVFCVQLMLFLFLGLAIKSGLTSDEENFSFWAFVGTLFAIPNFLFGMTNLMTIAMAFTHDTWNGSKQMKTAFKWDSVLIDWISTVIYIFVPLLVGGICLSAGSNDWWEYTLVTWFSCIFAYFLLFSASTIFHEIDGCLQLVRNSPKTPLEFEQGESKFSIKVMKAAIIMQLKAKLSGVTTRSYTVTGRDTEPQGVEWKGQKPEEDHDMKETTGPLSKITMFLAKFGLYKKLDNKHLYNVDLVRGYTPYATSDTWGLEKLYCRNRKTRYIAVIEGKSALTKNQVLSSLICYFIGFFIQLFLFIALMVWFELPAGAVGVIAGLYSLWSLSSLWTSAGLLGIYNATKDKNEDNKQAEVLYQVTEDVRINEPTKGFCWIVLAFETLCFFWFPLGALLQSGNYPVGFLFLGVSIVTILRRYLNSTIAVREFGTLDGIDSDNTETGLNALALEEDYREKNRLARIVSEISSGRKNDFWMKVFAFSIIVFCGLFMAAVWKGADSGSEEKIKSTPLFEYPGSNNLEYTSCSAGGDIVTPDDPTTALVDFAFLSVIAYGAPDITNATLQEWFDPSNSTDLVAFEDSEVVNLFREEYERENGASSVSYKVIGFPKSNVGVIAIRGTSNGWDALADAQLWSSASIAQWLRAAVPLGNLFTPVLEYIVEVVSWIQADSLADIAFYKQTSAFVKHMKESSQYDTLIITGHSLGGGLAMISGAQTEVPAIALSGPNAVISRRTFSPPVSIESLEKYTFNIVPDRDVVPRLDDLSQNYQRIKCRSGLNDPLACHSSSRSLCELLYQCGSKGRPIPCHCLDLESDYGNPQPVSSNSGGASMQDVCTA